MVGGGRLGGEPGLIEDDDVDPAVAAGARLGGWLGLTKRKTPDWRMAEEITEALRAVCPDDPAKFDYPLTRLGILRICTHPRRGVCGECPVAPLCSRRAGRGAGN